MKNIIITATLSLLILIGCGLKPLPVKYYVVQRDVPISPTFVVVPFNDYQPQFFCAEQAEAALIAAGVKVVMWNQKKKDVEISKRIDAEQAKLGHGSDRIQPITGKLDSASLETTGAYAMRVERFIDYGEISADYIVRTNGNIYYSDGSIDKISVRIIKKDSNEVLSSFVTYTEYIKDEMYKNLQSLGIKVKQTP
jgi:hypothetical protein